MFVPAGLRLKVQPNKHGPERQTCLDMSTELVFGLVIDVYIGSSAVLLTCFCGYRLSRVVIGSSALTLQ